MASTVERPDAIAAEVFRALGTGAQIAAFSTRLPDFTLEEAYRVTEIVRRLREDRGERPVGRKIGFTNRTIWAEYGVSSPIWGYLYDCTVFDLAALGGAFRLQGLAEPRIEPEIAFQLRRAPEPGLDDAELLGCIAWVAHGFEIVQSLFPGWRFAPADTVAAFGLHGALLLGSRLHVNGDLADLAGRLATFTISLSRNRETAARGAAADVLDGPLSALRHLIGLLGASSISPPLKAGEIVTTGTLTRALPIAPGETWTTALEGTPMDGISVRFE